MHLLRTLAVISLVVSANAGPVQAEARFIALGDLAGGEFWSQAYGVSDDGSIVVGESRIAPPPGNPFTHPREAFLWTATSGMVGLGHLPGISANSIAYFISADGSVVVGFSDTFAGHEAFVWNATNGMMGLGYLPGGDTVSAAFAVSSDGSVVVGGSRSGAGFQAFTWDAHSVMVGLGDLPGGAFRSDASAVSGDGSVVVGGSDVAGGQEAFLWDATSGMIGLGDLPGGAFSSHALAVSDDGSVVAGQSDSASGRKAFLWDATNGMVGLGDLPGGAVESLANAVSADGSSVVGWSESASGTRTAFIWDGTNGIRSIQELLVNDFGLDLSGWTLEGAIGISSDGHKIVGWGDNPSGHTEAWIALVPEPSVVLGHLVALGTIFGLARRRPGHRLAPKAGQSTTRPEPPHQQIPRVPI